ncbi:MAG: hypothetical protein JWO58_1616 [Chitinophagaceae bacterium]|nr:hypothetical protein [Chitinophagaceae bacterium]
MKTQIKKILFGIMSMTIINISAHAQPPHHHGKGRNLETLSNYTGKIISYTPNQENIYDGFLLDMNGVSIRVAFPKHMGKQIMGSAKPGANATVNGFMDYSPEGIQEIHLVSMTVGTNTVYDVKRPKELSEQEEFITLDNKVIDFSHNREGQIDGLILSNKTILRFPKHAGYQFSGMVQKGDMIKATGYVKKEDDGVAFVEPTRIVKAETVVIKGTSYLIR